MMKISSSIVLIPFLLVSFLSCSNQRGDQQIESTPSPELPSDGIKIAEAWARPAQMNGVSAIYMSILNGSSEADTLLSLSSPVAGMTEVHESYEREEGMMGMRPTGNIAVPASNSVHLKPGGLHVMLMKLTRDLAAGDEVELTLAFAEAGEMSVIVPVQVME